MPGYTLHQGVDVIGSDIKLVPSASVLAISRACNKVPGASAAMRQCGGLMMQCVGPSVNGVAAMLLACSGCEKVACLQRLSLTPSAHLPWLACRVQVLQHGRLPKVLGACGGPHRPQASGGQRRCMRGHLCARRTRQARCFSSACDACSVKAAGLSWPGTCELLPGWPHTCI